MPNWAIFDISTNRVKNWVISSPHDPVFPVNAGEGAIKDPDVATLIENRIPVRHWKQDSGAILEMSQAEKDTVEAEIAQTILNTNRAGGKALVDLSSDFGMILRAFADIVKDEFNILRQRDNDRAVDVASATNLGDLKTRWAAHPSLADRTLSQLRDAIKNRIDSGNVDS